MASISFEFNCGVLISTVERSVVSTVRHSVVAMSDVSVAGMMALVAMAAVSIMDVATSVVSRGHSSMSCSSRSLWLPRCVSVTSALKSGVTLVFSGDSGTALNFIETLKVDVLQVGHGDVLHVGVVESALGTVHISMLLHNFLNNLWGRSDPDRAGLGRNFLNNLRNLHRRSEINFLLATARSADYHQANQDGAERNDEAYEDAPYNLRVPGLLLRCKRGGRQNATDEANALFDN